MSDAAAPSRIRVPASTSNLGAGFDALGLALGLYLEVDVTATTDDGKGELRCAFAGRTPPGENLIVTGFRAVCEAAGATHVPSLDVHVTCAIPPRSGLGSSAAALVAGGRLAARLVPGITDAQLIDTLTAIEGHPDNVAASVLGGLVAGALDDKGHVLAVAAHWPENVRLIVATPAQELLTRAARGVLPAEVSRADAVFNIQRVALLLQAVATGRTDVLREALRDRLHQPYRAPLVPGLEAVLELEAPGLLGAFLSGAGPSVAVCVEGDAQPVMDAIRRVYRTIDPDVAIRVLDVHQPSPSPASAAQPTRETHPVHQ